MTGPLSWTHVEDRDELRRLEALLGELADALAAERAAIAAVDPAAVDDINREKQRLTEAIETIAHDASAPGAAVTVRSDGSEHQKLRAAVRSAAERVRREAQANVALLGDALGLVQQALGTGGEPTGYDRRARRVSGVRMAGAKPV